MWLIDTATLVLKADMNPAPGSYAILSHTWEEDEVSFQDFQDLRSASKNRGFEKIKRTCSLALERGLRYAWVDTCCIDKTSSAELSESINSMFKWYQNAAVCFAFLSDLKSDVSFEDGFHVDRCRWLTRGWTLQELIAPQNVEFYDETWSLKARKSVEYTDIISRATGVDVEVLLDSSRLSQVLVARRMSWASHRETTRVEDQAYCLLGIFDINMPMLYGEREKAFMRLQEEIARQSTDLSLFAWRADESSEQRFRGIFAKAPNEFARCSRMCKEIPSARAFGQGFVLTNNGLQIETGLWRYGNIPNEQTAVEAMNLHILENNDLRYKNPLCVFLTKTPQGYVRFQPQELYSLPTHDIKLRTRKLARTSVNILKDVADYDQDLISRQYEGSVYIESHKGSLFVNAQPKELWDNSYRYISFIGPGTGFTGYVEWEFYGSKILLLFSTIRPDRPWCKMFSEIEPYIGSYHRMKNELRMYHTELGDCLREVRYSWDSWYLLEPRNASEASCRVNSPEHGQTTIMTAYIRPRMVPQGDGMIKIYLISFQIKRVDDDEERGEMEEEKKEKRGEDEKEKRGEEKQEKRENKEEVGTS
ncbi:HET-domain-containing protein [Xylariomycetidae sp. FL2044]|nr:HET-domain-containing protein [Xylariomycetidae sp. FL2044]